MKFRLSRKLLSLVFCIAFLASPQFAVAQTLPQTGNYNVYLIPWNHSLSSFENKYLTDASTLANIAPGNDGYPLESGNLIAEFNSLWLGTPANFEISSGLGYGSYLAGKSLNTGLTSDQANTQTVDLACKQIEAYLSAPNRIAPGVAFYGMNSGNNCSLDLTPSVTVTTADPTHVHVTLTARHNHIQGNLTTPTVLGSYADPCVAEDFDLIAETDVVINSTSLGLGNTLSAKIANASQPSPCNVSGAFVSAAASVIGAVSGRDFFAMAQNMLNNMSMTQNLGKQFSTSNSDLAKLSAKYQLVPQPYNNGGNFGYAFFQKDPPTNFSGVLQGKLHIDAAIAKPYTSCDAFKITTKTQIGADVPAKWDHGSITPPTAAYGSYGTMAFATKAPVVGAKESTCAFTMTGLPLGYDTSFSMTGGPPSGTTMSLKVPYERPLGWSGETVVAANSTGDFNLVQNTADISHAVGTGVGTAASSATMLLQHGSGGDPAQDALTASRAFALNAHDYASLGALAAANVKLGKTADARAQFTQAIGLALAAHDTKSAAQLQVQLKALSP